ncbi:hypothetical protein [Roseicella aquatilis]|uniref:Uncharacterized protein n=1 Tax=Roseicella aquatilis TaxID=2527868 RepID=A0A4R4DD22_9PROT|nr:hypothetical protein [Roseicella aquatilis]TCZ58591.1 hypothetical protein EXY23_16785 [Roseicella aquatilis]
MDLLTTENDSKQTLPPPRRSHDDSPMPGQGQRADKEAEALFDIADFEAIATFAGIRPGQIVAGPKARRREPARKPAN